MIIEDIINEVIDIIKDDYYSYDILLNISNKELSWIASKVLLPDLDTKCQLTTNTISNIVSLPNDFHRNIYKATPIDLNNADEIKVYNNVRQFLDAFNVKGKNLSDDSQWISGVCRQGNNLLYAYKPVTPQTFNIYYYRKPKLMVDGNDIPEGIPDGFEDLLINRMCFKIFSRIEDGIEGQKINTQYYFTQSENLLNELEIFLKQGISLPKATVVKGEFL